MKSAKPSIANAGNNKNGGEKSKVQKQPLLEKKEIPTFDTLGASNIDDANDLFTAAAAINNKQKSNALNLDAHPERRAAQAFAAYEERELPNLRKENKSLRLTQVKGN